MGLDDLPLRHVCVITPTRWGISQRTRACIEDLVVLGARRLDLAGVSDVALARNVLLTRAHDTSEEGITCFLLVDDDITFNRAQAQLLVEQALSEGIATSAVYPTDELTIAGMPWRDGLWLVGLGFCAVPRACVSAFASRHARLPAINGITIWPFCKSAPAPEGETAMWWSEDYWFSFNMGGVRLARMAVTHWKPIALFADDATLDALFRPTIPPPEASREAGPSGPR
jgi:hypothetical protein